MSVCLFVYLLVSWLCLSAEPSVVMAAEVVKHFFPKIVDMHNYIPANSTQQKLSNWNVLNRQDTSHFDLFIQIACNCKDLLKDWKQAARRPHTAPWYLLIKMTETFCFSVKIFATAEAEHLLSMGSCIWSWEPIQHTPTHPLPGHWYGTQPATAWPLWFYHHQASLVKSHSICCSSPY